jgi:hypothetical protein
MAYPVVASTSTAAVASDAASSFTLSLPASAAVGDLLLILSAHAVGYAPSTPSGWTQEATVATNCGMTVLSKIAASGDISAGSVTMSWSSGYIYGSASMFRLTGATSTLGDLVKSATGNGYDDSAECNNLTTASAENLVLWMLAHRGSSASHGSLTEVVDYDTAASYALAAYSQQAASAGSVTGPTLVPNSYVQWATVGVAIPPSGGAASITGPLLEGRLTGGGILVGGRLVR